MDLHLAQAVSGRLPTVAAQVRFQVRLCGICGGKRGTVAGYLQVLGVTLSIIPPTAPHILTIQSSTLHRLSSDSVIK
jgi:hypothetical protein